MLYEYEKIIPNLPEQIQPIAYIISLIWRVWELTNHILYLVP